MAQKRRKRTEDIAQNPSVFNGVSADQSSHTLRRGSGVRSKTEVGKLNDVFGLVSVESEGDDRFAGTRLGKGRKPS